MKKNKSSARTVEFWKWFGKSKITDERENPLVVYHGTNSEFDEFDLSSPPSANSNNDGYYGNGIYSTTSRSRAEDFGDRVMELYVSVQAPFYIDGYDPAGLAKSMLKLQGLNDAQKATLQSAVDGTLDVSLSISLLDEVFSPGRESRDRMVDYGKKLTAVLRANGYDGVIAVNADADENTEIVAFSPDQVRLAD